MEQNNVMVLGGRAAGKTMAAAFAAMTKEEQEKVMSDLAAQNKEKQDRIASPANKQSFEAMFGADQNRTPAQWRNLVKMYGMDRVRLTEKMTIEQVTQRMNESFTAYYKRTLKAKRVNV